ncbi:hypothetical protein HpMS212_15090 [Helicobacter pylori]
MLKQATERFNQRNREFRERQKRAINHARESYSRISKTKQRLLEIRDRNLELERELRNAIANTQHTISQISSFRESRESRIKASDTNLENRKKSRSKTIYRQCASGFYNKNYRIFKSKSKRLHKLNTKN